MTWGISHSPIAWTQVRINLRTWNIPEIIDAVCDDFFQAFQAHLNYKELQEKTTEVRRKLHKLDKETLVDLAIECIEQHQSCSNGGWEFYIDREGYHTVPVALCEDWRSYATGEEIDAIEAHS